MTDSRAAGAPERTTLAEAFADETRRGVQLAAIGRAIAFLLLWAAFYEDALGFLKNPYFQYRTELVAAALVSSLLSYLIARRTKRPVLWCFVFLVVDLLIVDALVFGWLPRAISDYPQFLAVRQQDLLFFIVILFLSILPLSRALAVSAGVATAAIWMAGVGISFTKTPKAVLSDGTIAGAHGWTDLLTRVSHPLVLNLDYLVLQAALLAALTGLLWLGVDQGRKLVTEAVQAEGERALLTRFFPPAVARHIAQSGQRTLPSARTSAAILFADFARDAVTPGDLQALKAYYDVVERVVFDHGGVIERFVGDPVMVVFGVLPGDDGSAILPPCPAALNCARALLAADNPVRPVVVGLHFGPVVSGEIGSDRQRAFGVVGDSVNLARRMMDTARAKGGGVVATAIFAKEVLAQTAPGDPVLQKAGSVAVQGLRDPIETWRLSA